MSDERKPTPTFWPGQSDHEEVGPIGDGTPHARMHWFWDRMERHDALIQELVPEYHPLRAGMTFEAAIALAFDRLAAGRVAGEEGGA